MDTKIVRHIIRNWQNNKIYFLQNQQKGTGSSTYGDKRLVKSIKNNLKTKKRGGDALERQSC